MEKIFVKDHKADEIEEMDIKFEISDKESASSGFNE